MQHLANRGLSTLILTAPMSRRYARAGAIIIATLEEDVLTGGAGVADDAASISVAGNVFRGCLQFAMLTV